MKLPQSLVCAVLLCSFAFHSPAKEPPRKGKKRDREDSPQAETTPSPSSSAGLKLNASWDSALDSGGSLTREDLAHLFGKHGQAAVDLGPHPEIEIYKGVSYLMPLKEAEQRLGVSQKLPSKNPVACPGFPQRSLSTYAYDGNFDGGFNRLYLVVDQSDNVVSVQLVDETPGAAQVNSKRDWHTYNFVNARVKAKPELRIDHDVDSPRPHLIRVNSRLVDPKRGALEKVRWLAPQPLVNLILHCVREAR